MNSEQLSMNILSQYMNSVANTRDIYENENSNNSNNNNSNNEYEYEQDHDQDYDYSVVDGMSEHDFGSSSHYHHYPLPSSSSLSSHRLNNTNDRKEKDKHRNDIYRRKIEQRKLYYFLLSNGSTVQSANPEKKKKEQVKERLKKRLENHKSREETVQRPSTVDAKDYESNSTEKKENLSNKYEMSAISNNSDVHSKKKKKKKVKAKTGKKKETKKTKNEHKEHNPVEKSDERQTGEVSKKLDDNDDCEKLNKLDTHESLANNNDNKDGEEMNLVDSDHSSSCDDLDERAATGDVAMEVESFDNNLYYQSSPDPTSEESTTIRQTLEMNISNRSFKSMKTEEYLTDHESTKGLDESKATYDEYDDKEEDNNNDTLPTTLEKQTIHNNQSKEESIANTNGGLIKKREKTKEKENTHGASSTITKHKRKKKTKNQNKNQKQNEEHSKENEKNTTSKDGKIMTKEQKTVQEPIQTPVQTLPLFLGKEKKLGEFNFNRGFGKTTESKRTPIASPFASSPSSWEQPSSSVNYNSTTTNTYTAVAPVISDVERKRPTKPPMSNRINCTVQIQPITINSIANDADIVTPKRPSKPPLKPSFQSPIVVNNNNNNSHHGSRPPIPVLNFARMKNASQSSNLTTPVSSIATITPNPISTPTPTPTPVSTLTSSTIPSLIPIGGAAASTMPKYPQLPSYPNDSQSLLESLGSLLAATSTTTTATVTTPIVPTLHRVNLNSYGVSAFPLIPSAMNTFSMHSVSTTTTSTPNPIYNSSGDTYTIPDLSTIEQADEWVDFELSSRSYPSSLWTLNIKSLKVHPDFSLDKLKVLMRSK